MTTDHPTAGHTAMVRCTALGAACGLYWATTTINPALSIIGLLPTPQQRTTALLTLLRAEVARDYLGSRCLSRPLQFGVVQASDCDGIGGHRALVVPALRPPGPRRTPRASST